MRPSSTSPFLFSFLILVCNFPSPSHEIDQDPRLIDHIIRDSAYHTVPKHRKTSVLYKIQLPLNLSDITAEVIRFRTGSLQRRGAKIKEFRVNPGRIIHPQRRRLIVIHQNLGSFSYMYNQNLSGYQLVSPVLGLLFYDTNYTRYPSEIGMFIKTASIAVNFSELVVCYPDPNKSMCATFRLDGNVILSNFRDHKVCVAWEQGHFAMVTHESSKTIVTKWKVILFSTIGVLGVVLIALVVVALVVNVKRKRSQMVELERRAYEEEALHMSMVGHVRAPTAVVVRTAPALEDEYNHSL